MSGRGGRMYPKALREEHGEQMEMWKEMEKAIDNAEEATLGGVMEAAHSAIGNHFESTDGRLLNNGAISRIIEKVLEWSPAVNLRGFYFMLTGKLAWLMQQKTASRVLEKLFKLCFNSLGSDRISRSEDEEDASRLPTLRALLKGTVQELVAGDDTRGIQLIDVAQDPSGSFALRVLLYVLAGKRPPAGKEQKRQQANVADLVDVDGGASLDNLCTALTSCLCADDIFANRCRAPPVSGLLDVVVSLWPSPAPLLSAIADDCLALCSHTVSSRLVESALQTSQGHSTLHPFFLSDWKTVVSRKGVHAVGRWLACCPPGEDSRCLESVRAVEEASDLVTQGWHVAVVVGAVEAGKTHAAVRPPVLRLVQGFFGVEDLKELPEKLLGLRNTKAGPLILSHLLCYPHSEVQGIFSGVPELPQWLIQELAYAEDGSIMFENFMKNCKPKELKKFAASLQGACVSIVQYSLPGAFVVEKLFSRSPLPVRRQLASELSYGIKELEKVWHGKKTIEKLRLEQFKHRPDDWEEAEKKLAKKDKLLSNILGVGGAEEHEKDKKRQQKRKAEEEDQEGKAAAEVPANKKKKKKKKADKA